MSWNGTVRCSYCYQKGHNRATCKDLKEDMQSRLKANPDDPYAKHYFWKKGKKTKRPKNCGWCHHSGHTRRTCKELKNAKKVAVEKCSEWRKRCVEEMKKTGLGIGALVLLERSTGNAELGILGGINWGFLDHRLSYDSSDHDGHKALVIHPLELELNRVRYSALPDWLGLVSESQMRYGYSPRPVSIIGPVEIAEIEKQIPSDFLDGKDCIEPIFKEEEKPQYRPQSWHVGDWCETVGFYDE